MTEQEKLLASALESSVADNVLQYTYERACADDVLEDMWQNIAEDFCDDFPDIESIMAIDVIQAIWKEEMMRRSNAISTLASINGVEQTVINVLEAVSQYDSPINQPRRAILDATYQDQNHMFKIGMLSFLDQRFSGWFLTLDSSNRMNLARDIIRYWRRSGKEAM